MQVSIEKPENTLVIFLYNGYYSQLSHTGKFTSLANVSSRQYKEPD